VDAPILVTGSHRSGTTWVGRTLALSPGVGYVHEPFFPRRWPGWLRAPLPHVYQHISAEDGDRYAGRIEDVLAFRYPLSGLLKVRSARQAFQLAEEVPFALWYRLRRARPLLKDPFALMAAEWLAERFGVEVVVTIRHPAAFVGSILRLDWPRFDFRQWTGQPRFMKGLAGPFGTEIRAFADREGDPIDEAILLWNVTHHVIAEYRDRRPGWTFVRHEDLTEEPVKGFRELYERLDLDWDPVAEAAIVRSTSDPNRGDVPAYLHRSVRRDSRAARWTWLQRLTVEERERIREGTAKVSSRFYGEEDWSPDR
jgi:Sulfotransferase family